MKSHKTATERLEAKRAYHKAWRAKNAEHMKAYSKAYRGLRGDAHRAARYGLTPEQYAAMREAQGNACALCNVVPVEVLRVDHDHVTGKVRALLCRKCNTGIGFLGDSVPLVMRAVLYLQKHAASGRTNVA